LAVGCGAFPALRNQDKRINIMARPPFNRRPSLLHLEAALAAFALSLPVTTGAQAASITINGGSDISSDLSSNRVQSSSNDPLTGTSGGYALVPLNQGSPIASNNSIVITDWNQGSTLLQRSRWRPDGNATIG
jgi:hypothetical protein